MTGNYCQGSTCLEVVELEQGSVSNQRNSPLREGLIRIQSVDIKGGAIFSFAPLFPLALGYVHSRPGDITECLVGFWVAC